MSEDGGYEDLRCQDMKIKLEAKVKAKAKSKSKLIPRSKAKVSQSNG